MSRQVPARFLEICEAWGDRHPVNVRPGRMWRGEAGYVHDTGDVEVVVDPAAGGLHRHCSAHVAPVPIDRCGRCGTVRTTPCPWSDPSEVTCDRFGVRRQVVMRPVS